MTWGRPAQTKISDFNVFDRLVELALQFIDLFYVARVVDAWESGIVLRLGRFHRRVGPGLRWVLPLSLERLVTHPMTPDTVKLDAQSLTTADDVAVVVSAVVTWRVGDVKKLILKTNGHEQVLLDSATGVLADHVTGVTWKDLCTEEFRATITSAVQARARRWGIKVLEVQLKDVSRCPSLRLFAASPLHVPLSHV